MKLFGENGLEIVKMSRNIASSIKNYSVPLQVTTSQCNTSQNHQQKILAL